MDTRIEIKPEDATAHMHRVAWADVLAEVDEPGSDAAAAVASAGGDPHALGSAELTVAESSGDGGLSFLVLIGTEVAVHILISLYDDFVRPRLHERFGVAGGDIID